MDIIKITRRFLRGLWTCPCGQKDYEDFDITKKETYTHNCSKCDKPVEKLKKFNLMLSYTPEEYDKLTENDIAIAKQAMVETWISRIK